MTPAEEMLIKHQGQRDQAMQSARMLSQRIMVLLSDAGTMAGLKQLDGGELQRLVGRLLTDQQTVIYEDAAVREAGRLAL